MSRPCRSLFRARLVVTVLVGGEQLRLNEHKYIESSTYQAATLAAIILLLRCWPQ